MKTCFFFNLHHVSTVRELVTNVPTTRNMYDGLIYGLTAFSLPLDKPNTHSLIRSGSCEALIKPQTHGEREARKVSLHTKVTSRLA